MLTSPSKFKGCLIRLASPRASSHLLVGPLMVGAVALLNANDDAWLKTLLATNLGVTARLTRGT
jgi:hypothetical protein